MTNYSGNEDSTEVEGEGEGEKKRDGEGEKERGGGVTVREYADCTIIIIIQ